MTRPRLWMMALAVTLLAACTSEASAKPVPTPNWVTAPHPAQLEVTPARAQEIVAGCGRSFNNDVTGSLYNLVGTPDKGWALIYSRARVLVCELNGDGGPYNAGGGGGEPLAESLNWVPVPFQVDDDSAGIREGNGSYRVVAGRVAPGTRGVTVTVGNQTQWAQTVNGTFLVAFDTKRTSAAAPRISAVTADGIADPGENSPPCLLTPDGHRIDLDGSNATRCAPAVRWR
ncbi:hypothetical protein [Cryptosporangium sp. NPDC048952]|uniref:hypothetical protein n=1 Tax=Cryptosporangium sp. NPDC048952 TaxID=3363961 RepID=UPI003715EC1E